MQLAGQRADRDRLQALVQSVEAHDHRGTGLGHLGAPGRIESRPTNLVAFHRRLLGPGLARGRPADPANRLRRSAFHGTSSNPSAITASHALQSSWLAPISPAVSSHYSLSPARPTAPLTT